MPPLVSVTPRVELPESRLQHLIGTEACSLSQQRARERDHQHKGTSDELEIDDVHAGAG